MAVKILGGFFFSEVKVEYLKADAVDGFGGDVPADRTPESVH
jgi:hypothetical protein